MPGNVKVWLITNVLSPLGHSVATEALHTGDLVVGGCRGEEVDVERIDLITPENASSDAERKISTLKEEGQDRMVFIELNVRYGTPSHVSQLFLTLYIELYQSASPP